MLIDYFIKKPLDRVESIKQQSDNIAQLKKQHRRAFSYRLKRFAISKVGLASSFAAGMGYQTLQQSKNKTKAHNLRHLMWLMRLL